ncbi:MAG: carbon-nitrogen hydrolase family protein [Desulfitobacteriaceae bacterium]
MSSIVTVAAVQMNCALGDKTENLNKASRLVQEAIHQGAQLIVVPELFNTGYRVEEKDLDLAESIPGETTNRLVHLSQENNVYIVGSIPEKSISTGVVYDTAIVTGPEGIIGSYRKIHLWDQENTRFSRGKEYPVFDLGFARLGVQICYEVGFPEGSRILALKGADIIVFPSAFGKPRLYAWDIASRARALENAVYVIAANRTGTEKGETTFGGCSRIIDPQGKVIVEAVQEAEVILAEIDLGFITRQRQTIPYLRDLNASVIIDNLIKNSF